MEKCLKIASAIPSIRILPGQMTPGKNILYEREQRCLRWRERHPEINHARQKVFVAVPATDHHRA
jgi:hypothetical protein